MQVKRNIVRRQKWLAVKLVRENDDPYQWTTGLQPLTDIANTVRLIPRDWISEDGFLPNEKFITYARPLIQGDLYWLKEGGLPMYSVLEKKRLEKKLPPLD